MRQPLNILPEAEFGMDCAEDCKWRLAVIRWRSGYSGEFGGSMHQILFFQTRRLLQWYDFTKLILHAPS